MPKKVLVALPQALLEKMDYIAKFEHRTRSDLFRECMRRYADNFARTTAPSLGSISMLQTADAFSALAE